MDTKLTLSVDKDVIEKAKSYAKQHKVSLSQIIENYLLTLTRKEKSALEPSPLIKSLSGVVQLDSDYDHKSDYSDYLNSKYE